VADVGVVRAGCTSGGVAAAFLASDVAAVVAGQDEEGVVPPALADEREID
jgi:hypothetical protein